MSNFTSFPGKPHHLTNLEFARQVLTAAGWRPRSNSVGNFAEHFTAKNMEALFVERHGDGWVANIQFKNVPEGQPDCVGTPNASPFANEATALLAGIALVCQVTTGLPVPLGKID